MWASFWVGEHFFVTPEQNISSSFVSSSTEVAHLILIGDWFRKYVSDALGTVSHYYVAKVVDSRGIDQLGKPTVVVSEEKERREAM